MAVYVGIYLVVAQVGIQLAVFKGIFCGLGEGVELALDLLHSLYEHKQIVARGGKLALGVGLSVLEHNNAGGLLEDGAALFGAGVHYLRDTALADYGIALLGGACAVQKGG